MTSERQELQRQLRDRDTTCKSLEGELAALSEEIKTTTNKHQQTVAALQEEKSQLSEQLKQSQTQGSTNSSLSFSRKQFKMPCSLFRIFGTAT